MSWLIGFFAKSALMSSPVGGFLKMIPTGVWKLLTVLGVLAALFFAHQHIAHKALKKADAAGYTRAKQEDAAAAARVRRQALALRDKIEALHKSIAIKIRSKTDAQIADINRRADDLLRRGPGKASCGQLDYPSVSAGAGGHEPTTSIAAGVAVDRLPGAGGPGLIALPFSTTIAIARQCDADDAEIEAWRSWYGQTAKAWPTHQ